MIAPFSQTQKMTLRAAHDFESLRVSLVPTSSELVAVDVYRPRDNYRQQVPIGSDQFDLELNVSGQEGDEIELDWHYRAEKLRVQEVEWKSRAELSTEKDFWKALYKKRLLAAATDPRQQFLASLDANTNMNFLPHVPGLDPDQLAERIELIGRVHKILHDRMKQREIAEVSINPPDRGDLLKITELFKSAASPLGGYDRIGSVLIEFACGTLRKKFSITIESRTRDFIVSDADSGKVFLFGELAICAQPVAPDFWTDALVYDSIMLQRYFLARHSEHRHLRWDELPEAAKQISQRARRAVDRVYRYHEGNLSSTKLNTLLYVNLPRPFLFDPD